MKNPQRKREDENQGEVLTEDLTGYGFILGEKRFLIDEIRKI